MDELTTQEREGLRLLLEGLDKEMAEDGLERPSDAETLLRYEVMLAAISGLRKVVTAFGASEEDAGELTSDERASLPPVLVPDKSRRVMRLYKADFGYVHYYLALELGTPKEALAVIERCDGFEPHSTDEELRGLEEIAEAAARERSIRCDDHAAGVDLWTCFLEATEPTVLACSEW